MTLEALGYMIQTRGVKIQQGPTRQRSELRGDVEAIVRAAMLLKISITGFAHDYSTKRLTHLGELPVLQKLLTGDHPELEANYLLMVDPFAIIARFSPTEWQTILEHIRGSLLPVIDCVSRKPVCEIAPSVVAARIQAAHEQLEKNRRRAQRAARTKAENGTASEPSKFARRVAGVAGQHYALQRARKISDIYEALCLEADVDRVLYSHVAERANELGLTTAQGNPYDAEKVRHALLRCKNLEQTQGEREES